MIKVAMRATLATLVLAVLTGLVYPLAITGIAQLGIRSKANGSLLTVGGQVVLALTHRPAFRCRPF